METGRVRAVLWKHLASREARDDPSGTDPTAFLPVRGFMTALGDHRRRRGPDAVRGLGHDYVRLWARTFPVFVRHLRGRPERALALFCDEVYPYLRGEARAARMETLGPGHARVVMASDLDAHYLCGLLEGFVAASGAEAHARPVGAERFEVRYRIHPTDRFARTVQTVAGMRVPLLATALAAGLVAWALAAPAPLWAVGTTLAGAVGAQSAANGLHDWRFPRLSGPLDVAAPTRTAARWRMITGYVVAAAAAAVLVWQGRVGVLVFAALGGVLSLGYPLVRDQGLGPLIAGLIHGPLIVVGSLYAMSGQIPDMALALTASAVPGSVVAAMLFVDDLADRPLDEAGGKRTMAVRLPRGIHAAGFAALIAAAAAALVVNAAPTGIEAAGAAGVLAAGGGIPLVARVARRREDPRALAPARAGTFAYHIAMTTALVLLIA